MDAGDRWHDETTNEVKPMPLFEPFAPLFELSREVDRRLTPSPSVASFAPPADVYVTEQDVTVTMDVPGLRADDLTIEVQEDLLTVRGERKLSTVMSADENQGRVWQRLERGFGRFERVLRVPQGLDPDRVTALVADGVLTLRIPRPETRRPRRIQISNDDGQRTLEGATLQPEVAAANN